MTIDYKVEHSFESVSQPTKYALLISNLAELTMEICLYVWLIHVSFVLGSFLKSFDDALGEQSREQQQMIN